MAKVIYKIVGGALSEADASTVGELKSQLGLTSYTATVNRTPKENDQALSEGDTVFLSEGSKAGTN